MPKQIEISNLPESTSAGEVEKLCSRYGKVAKIIMKGTVAYVDMSNDLEADATLDHLKDAKMGMNYLNVNEARPRQE